MYVILIISIFILFISFSLIFSANVNISSHESISKKRNFSSCIKFMDNNWDIFETRFGSLTDDMIRKQLFPLIKEMKNSLSQNECIYDVGGNVGDITKMFNGFYPSSLIYTIEPVKTTFRELERKFGNINNIKLHNFALGSFNGDKVSHTLGDGSTGDYLYPGRLLSELKIQYVTIDSFYKKYCI